MDLMKHLIVINVGVSETRDIQAQDIKLALEHCVEVFGAGTVVPTQGAWSEDGILYLDAGLQVSIVYGGLTPREKALQLAARLKDAFKQICVLLSIQKLDYSEFI